MDTSADKSMPPRPDTEFDFNLPHGIDGEEDATSNDQPIHNSLDQEPENYHDHHDSMEDVQHTTEPTNDINVYDQNTGEQDMNYEVMPKGFSDDEDAGEAFDRSWSGHQAQKSPPKNKKSPKRSSDDGDDEASHTTKKPRVSLFGGPMKEDEEERPEEEPEEYGVDRDEDVAEPKTPGHDIGNRLSSLNLEQQEREVSPTERPLNVGFGLPLSDRGSDRSMSPTPPPDTSGENVCIPPDTEPAYDFRTNIERKKTFTYVDQDTSGNFDPAEDARQKTANLNKAKAAKAAKAAAQFKAKGKQRASKETVMKCIVKLRFERFGNVRNYTNDEHNWPDEWSEVDSDAERELQEYRSFFRRRTPDRERQISIEDPTGELEDLTGHPAARGCKSCRELGSDCSMVEGGTYPCEECSQEGLDCQLIIPPKEKGCCKQCMEDGEEVCSFETDPEQAICDYCALNEQICEALPPTGYRPDRIIIDEIIYGSDRPYAACTVCRQEKKRCSLKKKTDKPPCRYCKKHNIGCTFYDLPKIDHKKKGKVFGPTEGDAPEVAVPDSEFFTAEDMEYFNSNEEQRVERSRTPEIPMEDANGHKGMMTKLKTCFSHPIQFGSIVNTADCNFCELPIFGFAGLFEKETHVIRWFNGLGYSELAGGHAENEGPTTMCQTCTMGRVQIIGCPQHDIQPIFPDDYSPSFEEVFSDLLEVSDSPPEIRAQLTRWCSFCFSPATHACCAPNYSMLSEDEDEEEIDGCGLKLCAVCEVKLKEVFEGDSNVMAATLDFEPKAKAEEMEMGSVVRADVGFLSRQGLLMKNLEFDSQQDEQGEVGV